MKLADVSPMGVKKWIDGLSFGSASKARTRNMISKFLDLAMLWEYIPVARNPMQLVRIKGSTKRQKAITIITEAQFRALVAELPEPYQLMVRVCGCLGLRVSETLGLKWQDFDFDACTQRGSRPGRDRCSDPHEWLELPAAHPPSHPGPARPEGHQTEIVSKEIVTAARDSLVIGQG